MSKRLLAVLLAAVMLFSLAACDATPTLYDVALAEGGKPIVTEATAFDTDSPTPREAHVLTKEEVRHWLWASRYQGTSPLNNATKTLTFSDVCEELPLQHLRRSPGGMYYSVFETETGGNLYLFFRDVDDVPFYRDKLSLTEGKKRSYMILHPSFYIEQLYTAEDFSDIRIGDPAEKVYALCPWAENTTGEFFVMLKDGIVEISIGDEIVNHFFYSKEFLISEWSFGRHEGYSAKEADSINDFRIWEFDLPKT